MSESPGINLPILDASPERIRALYIDAVVAKASPPVVSYFQFPIGERLRELEDQGRAEDVALLRLLYVVVTLMLHEDEPKRPFRPQVVMTDGARSPLPEDFSDEHFEALITIRQVVANLELEARISDVLWHRKRRNPDDAKAAINAYLGCAEAPGINWNERHQRMKRAFQLALALGRGAPDSFAAVEAKLLEHVRAPNSDATYYAERLLRLLLVTARTTSEQREFAELAIRGGLLAVSEGHPMRANAYFTTAGKWFDRLGASEDAKGARIQAADTTVSNALSQSQAMAQASMLADALKELRKAGAPAERVSEIRQMIDEAQRRSLSEMTVISTPIDLSEDARKAKAAAAGCGFEQGLRNLALRFKAPPIDRLKEEALQLLRSHPLAQGLAARHLDNSGRVIGVSRPLLGNETEEEALIARMREGSNRYWQLAACGIVEPYLEQMMTEHAPALDDFLDFAAPKPFVPPGRENAFARGLRAGFFGEWFESAHILVPQVENALRLLLGSMDEIVYGQYESGVQDVMKLDQVLAHPKMVTLLGEDMTFDLAGLLVDRLGANLRNRLSHGLLEWTGADRNHAVYLWWLTVRIMHLVRYV
jgi:hypothetical protein